MTERSFSQAYRLLRRREFSSFTRQNPSVRTDTVVIQWKKNDLPVIRIGITMANRFGKAVERTRFRRHVREAFRLSELRYMQGFDLHVRVIAKEPDGFHALQKLFAKIAQILKKRQP